VKKIPDFKGWPLKRVGAWITENMPGLTTTVEPSWCNTDRKYKGSRLRWPGKGRSGYKLTVYRKGAVQFTHNSAETYRSNDEIARKLRDCVTSQNSKTE
jgi:hypothetical protein